MRAFTLVLTGLMAAAVGGPLPAQDAVTNAAIPSEPAVQTISTGNTPALAESPVNNQGGPRPRPRSRSSGRSDHTVFGGDFLVRAGETVGDVVVIDGQATIDGTVEGDLVVVLGSVKLGPTAHVKRDFVSVSSFLEVHPETKIEGHRTVVGSSSKQVNIPGWVRWPQQWVKSGLLMARPFPPQLGWLWLLTAVAILVYALLALLFPRQIQATVNVLEDQPGQSFLLGLLVLFLTGPALLLLVATVVGVVVLPFIFSAMIVVLLFGKAAVLAYTGQWLGDRSGLAFLQRPVLAVVAGALLLCVLYMIPILGFLVWAVVLPLAIGSVLKAMSRKRDSTAEPPLAAAPLTATFAAGVPPVIAPPVQGMALLARAGFWIRIVATLLDLLLVGLVDGLLLHGKWFLLLWLAYHIGLWSWRGTTVGGILCGLKIVRTDGSSINVPVALVRSLASIFSFCVLGLGFFWAGWTRERMSWHDRIADTMIVRLPKNLPAYVSAPPSLTSGAGAK